jgi:hypothetical protein
MVMSSDSGRLVGENVFKRKKRKTTGMPDSPTKKKIPTGAKKATPTVAIPDAPRKPIPSGATKVTTPSTPRILDGAPSKTMPAKPRILDGAPSKTTSSGTANLPSTAVSGGAPKQRKPRPQNPDLLKGGMNGVSTLTSALTVGKQLNGMANAMKQKKPF